MEKIILDPNRSCFTCRNINLCKYFAGIDAAIKHPSVFNINGTAAPNGFSAIFMAAASACTMFEAYPEQKV